MAKAVINYTATQDWQKLPPATKTSLVSAAKSALEANELFGGNSNTNTLDVYIFSQKILEAVGIKTSDSAWNDYGLLNNMKSAASAELLTTDEHPKIAFPDLAAKVQQIKNIEGAAKQLAQQELDGKSL